MKKLRYYDWIALIILIISGINWGLYGLLNINLVDKLGNLFFNQAQFITKAYFSAVIYLIIGITGLYGIYLGFKLINKN